MKTTSIPHPFIESLRTVHAAGVALCGTMPTCAAGYWTRLGALAGLLVAWTAFEAMANAPDFKVMVVHPTGSYAYHTHDLDWGLTQNGIAFQHYPADEPDRILADLDAYDMLMFTPLVKLNEALAGGVETVRAWVAKGRALVVTDACDASLLNPWLAELLPDSPLSNSGCAGVGTVAHTFVRDVSPIHPLRNFPERLDHESRQWHCLRVEGGWETVATCSGPAAVHPVTVAHRLGSGLVYVSSMQQRWRALPANLRANLALRRIGLAPTAFALTPVAPGPMRVSLELKSLLEKPEPLQMRLRVAASGAPDAKSLGTVEPVIQPNAQGLIAADIPFSSANAGPVFLSLEARTPKSAWIPLFSRTVEVPPSLSVLPPRYRGVLSTERRVPEVMFEVRKPGAAGINAAKAMVFDPSGRQLGAAAATFKTNAAAMRVAVPLPKLKAGEGYVVKVMARNASGGLEQASSNFVVRAPGAHPGDTIVDEDGTLLVDGKPFFPLGIYHLYPDAYPEVAEIGFNTVQTFQWMTRNRESLDAAQALGLKVVFEKNDKTLPPHRGWPSRLRDHPALLMWYAPDEPLHEPDHAFALDVDRIYRAQDPWHPVVRVNFNPPRFDLDVLGCDILAPYNYCLGKGKAAVEQPYWKIAHTIEAGRRAAEPDKPVFTVLQAFGHEDAEAMRVSAWLALTQDVRGIFWYAWDERNGVGMAHSPTLRDAMKGLLAQLRELTPALVAPVRRPFIEGGVHGLVCRDGDTVSLIVVNMNAQAAPVPAVPELRARPLKPLFGAAEATVPLEPLECRAYRTR